MKQHNFQIKLSKEFTRNIQAISEMCEGGAVSLDFSERLLELIECIFDSGNFLGESILTNRSGCAADARNGVITLYPSDSLRILFDTILAGDFNSVFFEHAYSSCVKSKPSKDLI